ncbi:MAG: DNA mismatch repair protein MutS [Verrucomicrobiota bacterium]
MSAPLTPMMQQYQSIRRTLPPGTIMLFRLGDFYEMFFEDAKIAAPILNVALTNRNGMPMCGIPFHAAEGYLRKLIQGGHRVAICDQVSEPQAGKIVQREVTQIISPGTVSDVQMLDSGRNNFVASIHVDSKRGFGFSYMDLSTGEFRVTELADLKELSDELARVKPAEVMVNEADAETFKHLTGVIARDGYAFLYDQAYYTLLQTFQVQALDGFGCADLPAAVCAAGALVHYLKHELRRSLNHVTRISSYRRSQFMVLDAATQANLELVESRGGGRNTSLLGALDRTVTPMGARRLRHWLLHPLCEVEPLEARLDAIGGFLKSSPQLLQIREMLKAIRDVERTVGRLSQTGGNARDMLVLRVALEQIPSLQQTLGTLASASGNLLFAQILGGLHALPAMVDLLTKALVDEPPVTTRDGGIFRDGYFPALDELRAAGRDGKQWIAELQQRAADETGIKSLKIRYTSVFGYFIEVTRSNLHLVPADWHRKQTVATGERFVTPDLKEVESKILGADEKSKALEGELFVQLRDEVLTELKALQETANAIGDLDALASLAETARLYGYCRPELSEGLRIHFKDGRHPVLDQSLVEEKVVPNDVLLDGETHTLLVLTGPNMAGKSTYIRQVALLTLMAQIGSWVPAKEAEVGLTDRIFTRVGANDDLSRGQSTFMVEMHETANITNNATARSLVILDEIGRGTSTFDGLSIAWSVAEYLHDQVHARTLFATHYHELTELARTRVGVQNFNVAVREWNDQIIFLRKIIPGGADKSYGIQVARLAGLPPVVLQRAREILANLEQSELSTESPVSATETAGTPAPVRTTRRRSVMAAEADRPQMMLFE